MVTPHRGVMRGLVARVIELTFISGNKRLKKTLTSTNALHRQTGALKPNAGTITKAFIR